MNEQLALFVTRQSKPTGDAFARRSDPTTSVVAAKSIHANALELLVLHYLANHPKGATSHTIADATGQSLVSISPRMKPLETRGKIMRDGREVGRTIWRLKA